MRRSWARSAPWNHVEFPYVYLDATYLHVRNDSSQVVSMAVVVATGVTATGQREILGLGVGVGDSEDEVFWSGFLTSLKQHNLTGVRLVISDQHVGLVNALKRCFKGAAHQRYQVRFARNLLAHVPKGQPDYVATAFRAIFAHADAAEVDAEWEKTRDELAARFPKLSPLMDEAKPEVLAFATSPREHWRKVTSGPSCSVSLVATDLGSPRARSPRHYAATGATLTPPELGRTRFRECRRALAVETKP